MEATEPRPSRSRPTRPYRGVTGAGARRTLAGVDGSAVVTDATGATRSRQRGRPALLIALPGPLLRAGPQVLLEGRFMQRPREQPALSQTASQLGQCLSLLLGLNAFCGDCRAK
jgi:hypothetical protein